MGGFARHDHDSCIDDATAAAEARCAAEGLRLTPARRRILEILLAEHRAVGAYPILDRLRALGVTAQAPAVYRALDFLVAHGFAHRIERLNAFVACARPGACARPAFMVCEGCSAVAEMPGRAAQEAIDEAARSAGFAVARLVVEAQGLCPDCQEAPA